MGLDVYMTQYSDKAAHEKWEAAHKEIYDRHRTSEKYSDGSGFKIDFDAARPEIKAYDDAHSDPGYCKKIEIDSAKHPRHMFKIGYLRSSYNEGGINSVLERAVGKTLYDVFARTRDEEYEFQPNWAECLDRCSAIKNEYAAFLERSNGASVTTLRLRGVMPQVRSPEEALRIWTEACEKSKGASDEFGGYENKHGLFRPKKPMNVSALIWGIENHIFAQVKGEYAPEPVVYVVETSGEPVGENWYFQALEVTEETCRWALEQPELERNQLWLTWSA